MSAIDVSRGPMLSDQKGNWLWLNSTENPTRGPNVFHNNICNKSYPYNNYQNFQYEGANINDINRIFLNENKNKTNEDILLKSPLLYNCNTELDLPPNDLCQLNLVNPKGSSPTKSPGRQSLSSISSGSTDADVMTFDSNVVCPLGSSACNSTVPSACVGNSVFTPTSPTKNSFSPKPMTMSLHDACTGAVPNEGITAFRQRQQQLQQQNQSILTPGTLVSLSACSAPPMTSNAILMSQKCQLLLNNNSNSSPMTSPNCHPDKAITPLQYLSGLGDLSSRLAHINKINHLNQPWKNFAENVDALFLTALTSTNGMAPEDTFSDVWDSNQDCCQTKVRLIIFLLLLLLYF